MGLFFSKQEEKRKTISRKEKDSRIGKDFSCIVCPRKDVQGNLKLKPIGATKPIIYIIEGYPSKESEKERKFSNEELKEVLEDALNSTFEDEDWLKFIRFSNVVKCCKNNEIPTQFEIDCCMSNLIKDIEETKPYAVFGLGNVPLKNIVNGDRIFMWRGRKVPVSIGNLDTWYFPMLHPSFILKNRNKNFRNEFDDIFVRDIKNAVEEIFSEYKKPEIIKENYDKDIEVVLGSNKSDEKKIIEYLNFLIESNRDFALDIETNSLNCYDKNSKILSIAIGNDKYVMAFPLDHKKAWNFVENRNEVLKNLYSKLEELLNCNMKKIVHNMKFDVLWLYTKFKNQSFMRDNNWQDTMAQAYLIDERTSKEEGMLNLDRLTQLRFGFNLKELSDVNKIFMEKVSLKDLLIYNGMDTKYTYMLFITQRELIAKENLEYCYNSLIETSVTLILTESYGVNVDNQIVDKFDKEYSKRLNELKNKMTSLVEIKEYERKFGEFNPLSNDHLVVIFKDFLNLPQLKTTKKGNKFSVDDEVLQKYAKDFKCKLAKYIPEYRSLNKRKTIYVDNIKELMIDGVIHPMFHVLNTATGRLSSGSEW